MITPPHVPGRLFFYNSSKSFLHFENSDGDDLLFVSFDIPWPGPQDAGYIALIEQYGPGLVVQRETIDALSLAYQLANFAPLSQSTVLALLGTLPTAPTSLPRFPDAYGGMQAPDGWSIVDGGMVVNPGG